MASSFVHYPALFMPSSRHRICKKLPQIRSQIFRDEEKSRRFIDANLQVLRERIEDAKIKERLEKCLACEQGWNYTATESLYYQKKRKKEMDYIFQCVELFCMVGGTIGFTILGCTICLYLTSMLIHLNL